MHRTKVDSSNLDSVGYDSDNDILEIQFKSSGIYHFFGVPFQRYQELMSASSHGRYFNQHIKNKYRYKRL